jgi:hypothetical protein
MDEQIDLTKLAPHTRKKIMKIVQQAEQKPRVKKYMLSARVPAKILEALDEYQKRFNALDPTKQLDSRTNTLLHIVKEACNNMGFDVSELPEPKWAQPQEKHEEEELKEETEPNEWLCPTGRMGGYARCEQRSKQEPEECKACKAIPKYYREILFPEEEEAEEEPEEKPEEKPKEKPITQKKPAFPETATPIIAPEPQEPSVIEGTDIEAQQAVQIKAIRERLEKKPPGQQKLGEE